MQNCDRGTVKLFESVAVVPETGERLGVLRWGIGGGVVFGAEDKDCRDAPSADFDAAVTKFHATPKSIEAPDREEHYDAIVDGFIANDKAAVLTADQKTKLVPVIAWYKSLIEKT